MLTAAVMKQNMEDHHSTLAHIQIGKLEKLMEEKTDDGFIREEGELLSGTIKYLLSLGYKAKNTCTCKNESYYTISWDGLEH